MKRLEEAFFARSCILVAQDMVGKLICRKTPEGEILTLRITEAEAYNGVSDTACHAYRGRTPRSEMLWRAPGTVYVYLCYGMHWMLNAITGREGEAEGVLIRACEAYNGPGKLTKYLQIDKRFNGGSFVESDLLWLADDGYRPSIRTDKRVGINYADQRDIDRPWRFIDAEKIKAK